ncbi:hypothetical protein FA15DRAFT_644331 [Coprinopsis marcescibilis]|uniref:CCD97-like C-terminal domain-containing protein n=1 Tax=Coprinopsis marcescibilis TaxID=230819 RepID=A0A5C3KQE0_COPMA|nr:hypothetical protein FA15DRAFT_644331 [Coprinopsis marcescibilis]
MSKSLKFDETPSLRYLGLQPDYAPSPAKDPIGFLSKHIQVLPPHILAHYSLCTTPKQRTQIPAIRNRRLAWTNTDPSELTFTHARSSWPSLWEGVLRPGVEEAKEERTWAETEFLQGSEKQVGKLGSLLSLYEEERENERVRALRRLQEADLFVPEEDEDTDEEDGDEEVSDVLLGSLQPETDSERQASFERRIRERFIYGLLEGIDYDRVDWDESLDTNVNDRDAEERWFDEDDEE